MSTVSPVLALLALAAGLRAANLWYRASKVLIIPMWETNSGIEPADPALAPGHWIAGLLETGRKSSTLNKAAALWTAGAVVLSAMSTVASALSPHG